MPEQKSKYSLLYRISVFFVLFSVPVVFSTASYSPVAIKTTIFLVCAFFISVSAVKPENYKPATLAPLAFIAWMGICASFSKFTFASTMPLFTSAGLFALFFTSANSRKENADFIRAAVAASCAIPLAAGILQSLFPGSFPEIMAFGTRVPSLLGNPNFFSAYIIAVLPAAAFLVLSPKKRNKILSLLLVCAALFCLFKTGSKAALFAAAVESVLAVCFYMKEKNAGVLRITAAALVFFAVFCLLLPAAFHVPYGKAFDIKSYAANESVFFRMNTWRGAFDMGMKNILTGTGPGSFSLAFPAFRPGEIMKWSSQSSYEVAYPENIFMQAFSELGLIGLLGSLGMVIFVLKKYDPAKKDLYLGFTGLLCMNLFGVDFNYVSSSMLAALFAGMIINGGGAAAPTGPAGRQKWIYRGAALLLSAIIAAGCVLSVRKAASDIYLNRAIAYSGKADWENAVENYKKALDADRYNITAGYFLAQAYYDSEKQAGAANALKQLEETEKLAPDFVLLHYKKALILTSLGRTGEAENEYLKMIKIDPYFKEALAPLAYISCGRGDYEKALSYINKALEKYPDDAALYSYLGNIYFASQRLKEAVFAYKKAVEISGNKDYYYNLGCIYYAMKDFSGARLNIDKAIETGGKNDLKVIKMDELIRMHGK
ncbi:MAG: tetratricopeptide repeat protein [Candidatus Goldiibacteriota bacterium]